MADSYNKLLKKAIEKRNTKLEAKKTIKEEADLSKVITIDTAKETSLLDHYNSIPEVEVDSNIKDFWNAQQQKLNDLQQEIKQPQDKYVYAVEKLLSIKENKTAKKRSELGANNLNEQEKEAQYNLKKAREQREKVMKDDKSNPFEMMFSLIGLNDEKFKERYKQIRDANKSVEDAKKRIKSIKEQKATFKEAINKLSVEEQMASIDMNDALIEISELKLEATGINSQSNEIHNRLAKQYEIIDKYKAIQALKNRSDYPAIHTYLNSVDPSLARDLYNIPESLPEKMLKISLEPGKELDLSTLSIDTTKITEIDSKISSIKTGLPIDVNINNISNETDKLKIEPTDTITNLETEKNDPSKTAKEKKILEMKIDYLKIKKDIENTKSDIKSLKQYIRNNSNASDIQQKLSDLKNKQDILEILNDDLKNCEYSKTVSALSEIETLKNEKENLEPLPNLRNTKTVFNNIEQFNIQNNNITNVLSEPFKKAKEAIENQKNSIIQKVQSHTNSNVHSHASGR